MLNRFWIIFAASLFASFHGLAQAASFCGHDLNSGQSRKAVRLTFVNDTAAVIRVNWVNFQGHLVEYATLASGKSYEQNTFASHSWVFTNQTGRCLGYLVAVDDRRVSLRIILALSGNTSAPAQSSNAATRKEYGDLLLCHAVAFHAFFYFTDRNRDNKTAKDVVQIGLKAYRAGKQLGLSERQVDDDLKRTDLERGKLYYSDAVYSPGKLMFAEDLEYCGRTKGWIRLPVGR